MWKAHKNVGRCIYCDSTDGLTREHVIPKGIGGSLLLGGQHEAMVLGDASCEECRKITHAFETEIQHKMMGHFRAATGMMSKRSLTPKRKLKLFTADGTEFEEEVDVDKIPPTLLLPQFDKAGFLEDKTPDGNTRIQLVSIIVDPDRLQIKNASASLAGLDPLLYSRMLAKIALGFNVWMIGLDAFKPLVRPFILGQADNELGHWISGDPSKPPTDKALHQFRHTYIPHNGKHYAGAQIRLFSSFGGPQCCVIVGEDIPGPSS